jgi:hypothetical protein
MIHLTRQLDQKLRPMVPSERVRNSTPRRTPVDNPSVANAETLSERTPSDSKIDVSELSARLKTPAGRNGR